jgi:ATP-dependent RNA helicase RhlE
VEAAPAGTPLEKISQLAYHVPNFNTKVNLVKHLLADEAFQKILIFTANKKYADLLFDEVDKNFPNRIGVIHSNKAQSTRFNTINAFQSNVFNTLIATDIVARGLDIDKVTHVINFDLPEKVEAYIHRIGRTGRAEKEGIAISFITGNDKKQHKAIEEFTKTKMQFLEFPDTIEVSDILIPEEKPKIAMKNLNRVKKSKDAGSAFHEKKDKNKKVNNKVRRVEELKLKYKKPKTRGDKNQNKKR